MDDLQIARDLRAAAGYLKEHGWLRGAWAGPNGGHCMGHALVQVAEGLGPRVEAATAALGFRKFTWVPGCTLDGDDCLTAWNDNLGRTVDEVLDRLESTALALEVRALRDQRAARELVSA
jgi:hypothetical protein